MLNKRRFRCSNKQCNRVFNEIYLSISRYQRMTNRLIECLEQETKTNIFLATAKRYKLSSTTSRRIFQREVKKLENYSFDPPRVIAIDEFAGTTKQGKYHLAIGDPVRKKLLDILPIRERISVENYLLNLPGKEQIKVVCIDMWKHFKNAIKSAIPEAQIVTDKFHVIRNVLWALDDVRKRVTRGMQPEDKKFIKGGWRLLLANRENLDEKGEHKLKVILNGSEEIRLAYCLKQWFRCWYHANTYEIAKGQLNEWYEAVENSGLKEFLYLKKTIKNWQPHI